MPGRAVHPVLSHAGCTHARHLVSAIAPINMTAHEQAAEGVVDLRRSSPDAMEIEGVRTHAPTGIASSTRRITGPTLCFRDRSASGRGRARRADRVPSLRAWYRRWRAVGQVPLIVWMYSCPHESWSAIRRPRSGPESASDRMRYGISSSPRLQRSAASGHGASPARPATMLPRPLRRPWPKRLAGLRTLARAWYRRWRAW